MGLMLQVSCSNHQRGDRGYGRTADVAIESVDTSNAVRVIRELTDDGWVIQFNGDNMDTYCSKECAK